MKLLMEIDSASWSAIATFLAAIATFFAAFSTFLTMRIHRRNQLDSIRPEFDLRWNRESKMIGEMPHDVISIKSIKNIGKGPALRISLNSFPVKKTKEMAVASSTKRLPILASGDTIDVDSPIYIYWKNVESGEKGHRFLEITVQISCGDERNRLHITNYSLSVHEDVRGQGIIDGVAPGVMNYDRNTSIEWIRIRKLKYNLKRIIQYITCK